MNCHGVNKSQHLFNWYPLIHKTVLNATEFNRIQSEPYVNVIWNVSLSIYCQEISYRRKWISSEQLGFHNYILTSHLETLKNPKMSLNQSYNNGHIGVLVDKKCKHISCVTLWYEWRLMIGRLNSSCPLIGLKKQAGLLWEFV